MTVTLEEIGGRLAVLEQNMSALTTAQTQHIENDQRAHRLIDERMSQLQTALEIHQERRAQDKVLLDRVTKLVVGNGTAGHDERIRRLEGLRRALVWVAVTGGGVVLMGALTLAWDIVKTYLQGQP